MKKKIVVFSLLSILFAALTVASLLFSPLISGFGVALYGKPGIAGFSEAVLSKIPTHFAYMFDLKYRVHSSFTLFFSILGV
ncbi:MAG: hypothetical protein J6328_03310, partial [Bacilli bacterium]|nr:hypothetical protein [Bacilli bacterium]